MLKYKDYTDAMAIMGFTASNKTTYTSGNISCTYRGNSLVIRQNKRCYATVKIENAIRFIEATMNVSSYTLPIMAAINTKNLAQNLVRVRSSNVWAIGFNVRKAGDNVGDLIIQFKNKNGGAGDCYIYYDVNVKVYRRFINSTSKGHFVWTDIRNNYKYSRLTGTKRGVLPNAINNW